MTLISEEFDDIYFSADDGFAETDYVFLKGCELPESWQKQRHSNILETGFGTGLNVLSTAKLFSETAQPDQYLDIISIEKYPLCPRVIQDALSSWQNKLEPFLSRLIENYPLRINALHPIDLAPNITLHLCFGDIADVMPRLFDKTKTIANRQIDAWFLDGFAPAKNPDMWCDALFNAIRDFSHQETRLATFTAAGIVKRGLNSTGLNVEKIKGFGRKRDMLIAKGTDELPPKQTRQNAALNSTPIAIIGGGIAGCTMAHKLHYHNVPHVLYEAKKELATGASSNPLGLINPKLTAKPTEESSFYSSSYSSSLTNSTKLGSLYPDIEQNKCGAVHLEYDEDKARRFKGYITNLGWHNDHIKYLDNREASDIAGIKLAHNAVFYPDASMINPKALCKALASNSEIITSHPITSLNELSPAHIIITSAYSLNFAEDFAALPINKVRGQISLCQKTIALQNLKTILNFGGYLSPYNKKLGGHVLGASYKKWETSNKLEHEDDEMNYERFNNIMPNILKLSDITSLNMGHRACSIDHSPIVGVDKDKNIAYSLAHGSHGLSSAIYSAHIITAEILGRFIPAYNDVYLKLKADRFDKK